MFGDSSDLQKFNQIYKSIKRYMRRGYVFMNINTIVKKKMTILFSTYK